MIGQTLGQTFSTPSRDLTSGHMAAQQQAVKQQQPIDMVGSVMTDLDPVAMEGDLNLTQSYYAKAAMLKQFQQSMLVSAGIDVTAPDLSNTASIQASDAFMQGLGELQALGNQLQQSQKRRGTLEQLRATGQIGFLEGYDHDALQEAEFEEIAYSEKLAQSTIEANRALGKNVYTKGEADEINRLIKDKEIAVQDAIISNPKSTPAQRKEAQNNKDALITSVATTSPSTINKAMGGSGKGETEVPRHFKNIASATAGRPDIESITEVDDVSYWPNKRPVVRISGIFDNQNWENNKTIKAFVTDGKKKHFVLEDDDGNISYEDITNREPLALFDALNTYNGGKFGTAEKMNRNLELMGLIDDETGNLRMDLLFKEEDEETIAKRDEKISSSLNKSKIAYNENRALVESQKLQIESLNKSNLAWWQTSHTTKLDISIFDRDTNELKQLPLTITREDEDNYKVEGLDISKLPRLTSQKLNKLTSPRAFKASSLTKEQLFTLLYDINYLGSGTKLAQSTQQAPQPNVVNPTGVGSKH